MYSNVKWDLYKVKRSFLCPIKMLKSVFVKFIHLFSTNLSNHSVPIFLNKLL